MPKLLAGTLHVPFPLTTVMTQMTLFPCFTVTVPPEAGLPGCWTAAFAFPVEPAALGDDPEVQAPTARHAAAMAAALAERMARRTMTGPPSGVSSAITLGAAIARTP